MTRFIIPLLVIIFISCSPVRDYRDDPAVKVWEEDIENFEQLDKTEIYPDDAVMFAGSSSIRLWSTLSDDMAPYSVIQRGYGGAKLSDFAVYADRIFSPHKCSALVMFVANDIYGGDDDKKPEEVKKLFVYVLKTFRKSHPDTPFFWIAVTPTSSRWQVWPEINKASERIKEVCDNKPDTYFITTDYAFLDETGKPNDSLFVQDKLHLNEQGYKIWTEIIKKELDSVLKN